ncbi:DNA polymerase Y family protein [Pseudactinotalea sp. HY158]|nr:DNA polymerase Y family protein [Pseudactinotalea sp. HY158]
MMAAEPVGRRIAVLWVPDWPVVAAIADGLLTAGDVSAVHDGRCLTAVSAAARRQGLRVGMTGRSARSLCPQVVFAPADPGRDLRAFDPIVQAAQGVVAEVALLRPGLLQLGIAGAARYQGSEHAVIDSLIGAVAEAGSEAQAGVADGLLAAILAARGHTLVPAGESPTFLAPHPSRTLLLAAGTRAMRAQYEDLIGLWRRLGLATLGDVARLRPAHVGPRFGDVGLQAHRLARGGDVQAARPYRPEPDLAVHVELEPPAARIDAAAFAARRLAEDLHRQLQRRGMVCAYLRVNARAQNGVTLSRSWRIDGALTANELTDRVRWQLEGWLAGRSGLAPSAPLVFLELGAEDLSPAAIATDGLWGRVGRGQAQAHRAALRMQSLLGPEGVLTPVAEGGRSPRDRIRMVAWGDDPTADREPAAPWPGQIPPPLPARLPAGRHPVTLLDARGHSVHLSDRGMLTADPATLAGVPEARRITGWAGPWPLHERWWEDDPAGPAPPVRAHLQVLCGDQGAFLLAVGGGQAGAAGGGAGEWWIEGIYD